jgi:hypothetical protein
VALAVVVVVMAKMWAVGFHRSVPCKERKEKGVGSC